jgi:hypothetical protein
MPYIFMVLTICFILAALKLAGLIVMSWWAIILFWLLGSVAIFVFFFVVAFFTSFGIEILRDIVNGPFRSRGR